jgi:hypothetical protein
MAITLPHKFVPRDYQVPVFNAVEQGIKRFLWVVHRRGGKDKTFINIMASKIPQRLGAYFYYFPTLALGRKILWDGRDKDGMKFLEHFPANMIAKKNEHEMKLTFGTGSTFQILGTDRLDVVGVNPIGCMFSEYAQQDPRVWDFIRPILAENGGWAGFNGTPRGKNHLHDLLQTARLSDRWFSEVLTVDDTRAIPLQEIENERQDGMSVEMIQQEFYCNFEFGLEGSYYAQLMAQASVDGRIGEVPHDKSYGVFTAWDIGVNDANAIWWLQQIGNWVHAIDYYEMSNVGIDHYANICRRKEIDEGYNYIAHYAPHDIEVREWSAEQAAKRIETARNLGINFTKIPKVKIKQDGIDCVRALLPLVRFDKKKCKDGIKALYDFQKVYNFKYKVHANYPLKNWAIHGADAFETAAVAMKIHGDLATASMSAQEAQDLESQYASKGAM